MKEKIQSKLEALAHPEIWCDEDWLELRLSWRLWYVCCTPQWTKTKHTSRGQYKTRVLSRYYRATQNRKQYISDNNIKSTILLNRWKQQVHKSCVTTSNTPMRTQVSTPYSFGYRFFSFEFINIISRFIIFIPLVSVRDTPLPYYYVPERDTLIP